MYIYMYICIYINTYVCTRIHTYMYTYKDICIRIYISISLVAQWTKRYHYSSVPEHKTHRNDPASVFLSTHWWSQRPACQHWMFLVVSFFYKPLRNCHPSQQGFKVQCKKLAKKNISILRFYVGFVRDFMFFSRDFMLIFYWIICFFKRFYVEEVSINR